MIRTATVLTIPRLGFLALFSLLVLAVLYRFSAVDDRGQHRVELAVNELSAVDLAANLELMKLRHRRKLHYDDLVAASQRGGELLDQLEPEFAGLGLAKALEPARLAWREKQEGIEKFKQLNSILSTSQFHFVNLAEELGRRQDSARLNQVTRRLLAFLMQGSSDDMPVLVGGIYQLDYEIDRWTNASNRSAGKLLVTHGSLILDQYRQAERLSRTLLDSPFAAAVNAAYRVYNEASRQAAAKAEAYRLAMAVFALLLVASVILALFRLGQSALALERSHRLLDNIADNLGEGILAFDAEGRLKFINRRAEILLGQREADLLDRPSGEVLAGGDWSDGKVAAPLLAALAAGRRFNGEDWIATAGGRLPVAYMGGPLPAIGNEADKDGYVLSFRDLSEERETQARLHLAAHVFDSLAEAMVITDDRGRIQSVNPAFTAITGFSEAEAIGRRPGELVSSGQHDAAYFAEMWQMLRQHGQWQGEMINRRKNGEIYTEWLSISAVKDADQRVIQYVGLFNDISERKEAEAYIHRLAYHDALTGLANRLLFRDRLDTALRQAQRSNRPLAVLVMDLDRFKTINDTLGHAAGDQLLKEVAQRLTASVRDCDTLARLGGDEFALLMPEIRSTADAAGIARKLLQALAPEVDLGRQKVFVTSSIGIAVFPDHGSSGEKLLRNADVALYVAKSAGRNTSYTFDPSCETMASDRLELETALRHAISRGELMLHYQLQVDAHSNRVTGAEALIRWQHPDRGLIRPDRFVTLAEQNGLIEEIGAWSLDAACAQFARWLKDKLPIPRIAVNVSARQLRSAGFVDSVMAAIRRHGLEPRHLELELTESMLTEDMDQAFAIFAELRRQGVRIAIDDFGTGYSSLNYLAQFPVDVIKIDRSFVRNLGGETDSLYVIRAIVLLAGGLKMETIAEGVETMEQRAQLAALGCDNLQGYLFARPQPAEALPDSVRKIAELAPVGH